jgi:cellulose synthase/poly-beta-1,6-N-acetylglucosamine synthase-like glycosyltransferase
MSLRSLRALFIPLDIPIVAGFLLAAVAIYVAAATDVHAHILPALLLYIALSLAAAVTLLMFQYSHPYRLLPQEETVLVYTTQAILLLITYAAYPFVPLLLLVLAVTVGSNTTKLFFRHYTAIGTYFMYASLGTVVCTTVWSLWFFSTIEVSLLTRGLLLTTVAFLIFKLPSSILQFFETFEVLCRHTWTTPRHAEKGRPSVEPKVVLQVPTYAEPPELVLETLAVLAKLDYNNYEVWVIDNNTKDESLWRPLETYCEAHSDRFHFIHVDNLKGAKAGALNYLNRHYTPTDTDIIGVIDADYHARPDFLSALVGYFSDEKLGFIQTPHDYRDWENNQYLRTCYYEYKLFFYTTMPALSERNTALTVGTMCLIRAKALADAGGWSEWCVTEDSELSVRIHAAGYSGIYLTESFGQGLIPDTFASYKKQRYRWTAGPVQEFFSHFALLWPWQQHPTSPLSFRQRLYHFHHGFNNVMVGMNIPFLIVALLTILSMVWNHEVIQVPTELFLAATIMLISKLCLDFYIYRNIIGAGVRDTVQAMIAKSALNHVTSVAAFKTVLNRNTLWIRTNKFKEDSPLQKVIRSVQTEVTIGAGLLLLTTAVLVYMPYPGLLLMCLIGISYKAIGYGNAAYMGYLEYTSATSASATEYHIKPPLQSA